MRTHVYADGLNLYYGALKKTAFQWLDLLELARLKLPPKHSIIKLEYFTSRVSGVADSGATARQQFYLDALGTLPKVETRLGSFLSKTMGRPIANLPVAGRRIDAPTPVTLPKGAFE